MKTPLTTALVFLGLAGTFTCTFPGAAQATPLLATGAMPAPTRQALAEQVRVAHVQNPALFQRVADLHGLRPEVYTATRIRQPDVSRELRALGPEALLPMLDVLAVSGYPRTLAPTERAALEVGLLEAVGALRDRRAAPVLRAAFEDSTAEPSIVAAARGLGALCGDGEVALLADRARTPDARGAAALQGLGQCRRAPAVQVLAAALDHARDPAMVAAAAQGLASAGSSWAQAARTAPGATPDDLPAVSAAALVRAFVRTSGAGRDEVRTALLGVGYADTSRLIADAARTADAPTRAALTELDALVRRSLGR